LPANGIVGRWRKTPACRIAGEDRLGGAALWGAATQFVMLCVALAHLASQYGKNTRSRGSALNLAPHRGQVSGAVRVVTGRGLGASTVSRLRKCCFEIA